MIFVNLVENLALLVACGTLYGFIAHRLRFSRRTIQVLAGVLFGMVAIAGMMIPFHYAPGIIFDGRSALLSIAGLFGGPITAAIAAAIALAYRLWLGGGGALTGIGVIITSSALGVGLYYKSKKHPHQIPAWQLYALGVVVHASMLLWMFSLPGSALPVLSTISLPVMLIFPLATLLLGSLLSDMERRFVQRQQLQKSWEQYQSIVDTQTELIDRWLPDGTLMFVNAAYSRYYGKTEGELVGSNWLASVVDEDRDEMEEYVQRLRTSLTPDTPIQTSEHREVAAGGEIRWTTWIDQGTFDEKGILEEIQSTGHDITERKQIEKMLRESEEQYRSIFESASDAVLIFNLEGKIVDVNPLACEMYGYSEEELIGLSASEIVSPDYFHGFKNFKRRIKDGGRLVTDSVNLRKDGTEFDIEMHGAGFTYQGEPHLLSVVRDITERKQATSALQQEREKIEQLHEIASQLGACESEDDVYRTTVAAAEKILSFSMCTLDIVEGQKLMIKATSAELPSDASRESELEEGGLAAETYRTGETTVFGSLDEVSEATPSRSDLRSGISAPIGDVGVFQVASTEENAFSMEDVRFLELLLEHTGEAVNRIRLQQMLREQAFQDPLTGVYNRRYFNQVIQQEIPRSKRYAHPIGFLMIDVNHFKEINDRYGHQVGDEVLQEVAKLLQQQVRESDFVVRYGGDEFLLILIETNGETEQVKQRTLKEVARRNKTNAVFDFPVTFSIGSAHWNPDNPRTVSEILTEADMRMYEEKRSSKGCAPNSQGRQTDV